MKSTPKKQMTDSKLEEKLRINRLVKREPQPKIDRCSKCGKRRPTTLMSETGPMLYVCRRCLIN